MKSSFKVVKNSEAIIRKIASNKRAYNFITKNVNPNVSLARIEAENFEGEILIEQNFIYYVLEGKLMLKFKKGKAILNPGDTCYVTKGSTYVMSGTFKTIVVSQPAFGT